MKKILFLVSLIAAFNYAAIAQAKFIDHEILEGKVKITIPATYRIAHDQQSGNYSFQPAGKTGIAAGLWYRVVNDSITDNEVPAYTDILIKIAGLNKTYKWIDDGIYLQDGKNIGYLKYASEEEGHKIFNYIFFTSVGNKPLIFQFNCPFKKRAKPEKEMDAIANSIRVKL